MAPLHTSLLGHFRKKIIGGFGIGTGFVLAFGIFLLVQAVTPGTVTNPTFGPTDDDVYTDFISGPFTVVPCTMPVGVLETACQANCPAGTTIISGACRAFSSRWYIRESYPVGNGWYCAIHEDYGSSAFNGSGEGFAICG
jgi:hypothetical protein